MQKFEEAIGKILLSISVSDGKEYLDLNCEDGKYVYYADADCCSHSWIEHYDSPTSPSKIINFEELPIEKTEQEGELEFYFYEIKTENGSYTIEMRNESNGYYGGSLQYSEFVPLAEIQKEQKL